MNPASGPAAHVAFGASALTERALTEAMAAAIDISHSALGRSTPNPPVGAVILDAQGAIVASGATEPAGGRHAEIVALDAAGSRARGGTAVVTLEPCDHTGRTGPCTRRLIDAGIEAVAFGVKDPSAVAAGGAETLQAAGITVRGGVSQAECEAGPLRAWLFRTRHGRPLVTWKYAASLDGRVAAADGTSMWITGVESRQHAHRRRAEVDAIVVGTGTMMSDDPSLTARDAAGNLLNHQPMACVMGVREVPAGSAVRQSPGGFRHIATRDPRVTLEQLGEVNHVLVEGGPQIAGAFLEAGLVDHVDAYLAPIVLGGGHAAVEAPGLRTLASALEFAIEGQERLGCDLHLSLRAVRAPIERNL